MNACTLPALSFAVATVFAGPALGAAPLLAPYPAPGGNSAASVGLPIASGGMTWTLGGFDGTAYTKLFYAVGDYAPDFVPGAVALTMDGSRDGMAFDPAASDLGQGIARWRGSTTVPLYTGTPTVYTQFTLSVTDLAGNPLALTGPGAVLLPAALGGVLDVGGPFKANWQFDASWTAGSGYGAAGPFYDAIASKIPGYGEVSSIGGAFYYTPPVPEPATLLLMLGGLAVGGGALQRRRTAG